MKFRGLQYCRAIAALLVVAFHSAANMAKQKYFGSEAGGIYELFWFGGDAGVDFFFVLSGFIIYHVHGKDLGRPERLGDYVLKRLIRIYPMYWMVFLVLLLTVNLAPTLRAENPLSLAVFMKSMLLLPQDPRTVGGTGAPLVVVAWSMQYELAFYILIALGIIHRSLSILGGLVIAGLACYQCVTPMDSFVGRFLGSHLMMLFFMGVCVAAMAKRNITMIHSERWAAMAAIGFLLTAIVATSCRAHYDRRPFDIIYGIFSSIIVFMLARPDLWEKDSDDKKLFGLSKIGDASYILYLIHFPLVSVLCHVGVKIFGHVGVPIIVIFLVIMSVCTLAALLVSSVVEQPITKYLSGTIAGRKSERLFVR